MNSIVLLINRFTLVNQVAQSLVLIQEAIPASCAEYKYLSCVPGVDGKIHPEGVVQHRR